MGAFVEVLSGIVRFGPECFKEGDPYRGAVAFSCDGSICVIKALTRPEGGLTQTDAKQIIRALRKANLHPTWDGSTRKTYRIEHDLDIELEEGMGPTSSSIVTGP